MIRAKEVLASGHWDRASETDTIELPHDGRGLRRVAMRANGDTVFMLDAGDEGVLREGDGTKREDGRCVRVVAAAEHLVEATAADAQTLSLLAYALGNAHIAVEFSGSTIRVAREPSIEQALTQMGASLTPVVAPFDPIGGGGHHHHDHGHGHHHHHEHGTDCGCGHDHGHDGHSHDHAHGHNHGHGQKG